MGDMQGTDLSHWNGTIDFADAERQIQFAMRKATQGVDYVDAGYVSDMHELRRLKLNRGSYHYADADSGTAIEQARFYVQHAQRLNGEMQALDFEGEILDVYDPPEWAYRWLSEVQRLTDNLPLIYMSGAVTTQFDWEPVIRLGTGLWVASWGPRPDPGEWPFAIMWQRDDTGRLHGARGSVDEDVFAGDAQTWAKYANNRGTPPAHPAPTPDGDTRYTVQAGDTLTSIAEHFDVSVEQIVKHNEIRHPSLLTNRDLIIAGWRLRIPRKGSK